MILVEDDFLERIIIISNNNNMPILNIFMRFFNLIFILNLGYSKNTVIHVKIFS